MEKLKSLQVHIPESDYERIRELASKDRCSMSHWAYPLIKDELNRIEKIVPPTP